MCRLGEESGKQSFSGGHRTIVSQFLYLKANVPTAHIYVSVLMHTGTARYKQTRAIMDNTKLASFSASTIPEVKLLLFSDNRGRRVRTVPIITLISG